MKPIKIDWDALDEAFHNQNDELVYYLDLITGHVVLEGEGEDDEDDYYPDDDDGGDPVIPVPTTSGPAKLRAYVQPPDTERKIEWMRRFLVEADLDAGSVVALQQALEAESPPEALRSHLNQDAEARDRWYLYRADRIHELIEEWLEGHGVAAVGDPPWR